MSLDDYLISVLMMSSVIRQLRGRRLSWFSLSWPVALVCWAAFQYAGGLPSHQADLALSVTLACVGIALGVACGALSHVYLKPFASEQFRPGKRDVVMVRSTGVAAALWIAGIGSRLMFGLFAEHGGGTTVVTWSEHLGLASVNTWGTALMAMSLMEVTGRTSLLVPRLLCAKRHQATTARV